MAKNNSAGNSTFVWGPNLRLDSTKSPFESPLAITHKAFADIIPVSWKRYSIGGILITIYGVEELAKANPKEIACLWLMHGRGDTQDSMAFTAAAMLEAWNAQSGSKKKGLICICFDQRNHGSRMVENLHNVSWKQGNATHGQDMFSTYVGTAQDLSLLITQVPMYLPFAITEHLCGGVSLGGHASWVAMMKDPRIRGAIIVVGCPDYIRLMTDRAVRSKLPTALNKEHKFLGSKDFPPSLIAAVEAYDPAGLLLSQTYGHGGQVPANTPAAADKKHIFPILDQSLAGKKLLLLYGGKDRLVPRAASLPFLSWLIATTDREGWASKLAIDVQDVVDVDAGHEFSAPMRKEAQRWLCEYLSADEKKSKSKF